MIKFLMKAPATIGMIQGTMIVTLVYTALGVISPSQCVSTIAECLIAQAVILSIK